jgi:hypothetical protein
MALLSERDELRALGTLSRLLYERQYPPLVSIPHTEMIYI